MDKTIAILFLEFRELVSQQIIDLSSTLMRHDFEVRNLREELSFLKKQIDDLSRQDVDIDSLEELPEDFQEMSNEETLDYLGIGSSN